MQAGFTGSPIQQLSSLLKRVITYMDSLRPDPTHQQDFLLDSLQILSNDKVRMFGPAGPMSCTPASLRGHIVRRHLTPQVIHDVGVDRFDIELAAYREIKLDWVVEEALKLLAVPDDVIQSELELEGLARKFSVDQYRQGIVKNLLYINHLKCAEVDWERVNHIYPNARNVKLDIEKDCSDISFDKERKRNPKRFGITEDKSY